MPNRHIVDRGLPERSKLLFYFPVPTTGGYNYVVELPFFENIVVKESKKAKYQKYSLISRSSNLYSYLGADSRKLKLSFNMTLPHILEEHSDITLDRYVKMDADNENLEAEKAKFKQPNKASNVMKGMAFLLGTEYTKGLAEDSARQVLLDSYLKHNLKPSEMSYFQTRYGISKAEAKDDISDQHKTDLNTGPGGFFGMGIATALGGLRTNSLNKVPAAESVNDDANMQIKYRIIDLIVYWTNIVRSSVVNYAQNPIYGPPIIRLRHGIMYQDIPCICTDYSIQFKESAGYDINTLLPRQISISMNLEEIRTGDFGAFDPTTSSKYSVQRDNLAGWEAVILNDHHSMDPGVGIN